MEETCNYTKYSLLPHNTTGLVTTEYLNVHLQPVPVYRYMDFFYTDFLCVHGFFMHGFGPTCIASAKKKMPLEKGKIHPFQFGV